MEPLSQSPAFTVTGDGTSFAWQLLAKKYEHEVPQVAIDFLRINSFTKLSAGVTVEYNPQTGEISFSNSLVKLRVPQLLLKPILHSAEAQSKVQKGVEQAMAANDETYAIAA